MATLPLCGLGDAMASLPLSGASLALGDMPCVGQAFRDSGHDWLGWAHLVGWLGGDPWGWGPLLRGPGPTSGSAHSFSLLFSYYGLVLDLQGLGRDIFLLQALFGAVDFLGRATTVLSLRFLGRRMTLAASQALAGLSILANGLVPQGEARGPASLPTPPHWPSGLPPPPAPEKSVFVATVTVHQLWRSVTMATGLQCPQPALPVFLRRKLGFREAKLVPKVTQLVRGRRGGGRGCCSDSERASVRACVRASLLSLKQHVRRVQGSGDLPRARLTVFFLNEAVTPQGPHVSFTAQGWRGPAGGDGVSCGGLGARRKAEAARGCGQEGLLEGREAAPPARRPQQAPPHPAERPAAL